MKSTVSDIIDQRLDSEELARNIDMIASSKESVRCWRNQHLIGDVIRDEVLLTGHCLVDRVQQVIESEPTILAPVNDLNGFPVDMNSKSGGDIWRAVGLFAIAASIALVAVIALAPGPFQTEDRGTNVAHIAIPGDIEDSISSAGSLTLQEAEKQSFEAEFGQMLVEHGEFSATSGLNGLIAYSKLVSSENLGE